ncbi:MAG: DNA polymerase I [Lachnospiraceae bacterium]|nr:DNA polymerase I [Lachnospiraceae bacterium]
MKKLMLIDGHSILNRAFYGLPDFTNQNGVHTGAILGFFNMMYKYLDEEKAGYLLVAFDRKEPTFRHKKFEAYKGTRKPMPKELHEQVPLLKEILKAMNIPVLERPGYEADDILGTIAGEGEKEGFEVVILSGDRDLLQLATSHVKIKIPKTKATGTITEDYFEKDVIEAYGVTPTEFIDLKGLMGDTADNIPGVPGIGEKTAGKIITTFHSIENAYDHIEEVMPKRAQNNLREYYDQALLSKELATIKTDCELSYQLEDAILQDIYTKEAYELLKELQLKSLMKRFDIEEEPEFILSCQMIDDMEEAEQIFSKAASSSMIGFQFVVEEKKCVGLSLSYEQGIAYFIPVAGFIGEDYLNQKMTELIRSVPKAAAMYVKESLFYLGVTEEDHSLFDTEVAAYLLNPLKDSYQYEEIARDYLSVTLPGKTDLLGKTALSVGLDSEKDKTLQVLGYLSQVPMLACPVLSDRLKEKEMDRLYKEIEMPTIFALFDMQKWGIRVEREALREYGEQLVDKIDELEQSIYELAGESFNINSPKQLGVILFEKLQLPFAKKTKTGYSTGVDVLEKLVPDYPIAEKILDYRHLTKLKSTYADGLIGYIGTDDRIHGIFNQTVTATGRISSTEPNLQNIPIRMPLGRAIRKVFVPEEGYVFVDADYSQIELRVLAHLSGDENLIRAYHQAQDIHAITASEVFDTPLEEITPLQRRNAKAVNFGIVYGISAFGLSEDLKITRKEASSYIEKYFHTYPQVKEFLDEMVAFAKKEGYVKTMFHRIRPIPELSSSNFMQRSFGERVAMNSPIQGTAADIIKIAMVRVNMRLKKENMKSRLILQIHDELLIEAAIEEKEKVRQILEEEMSGACTLKVPLEIDIEEGNSWYDAK